MRNSMRTVLALLLAAAVALPAATALANTAANARITNTAQLTFDGGSAVATVTVTVALVPSQPNVSITNVTGLLAYTAPDTPAGTDNVVITSTANGQANYTVTPSVNVSSNATVPSVAGGATVTIGATVTVGTSGTTYVTVPASGASGDHAVVNGIAEGASIVFAVGVNTYTRQVSTTIDNLDGTFRLNWLGGATAVAPAGTQVGEQKTVPLSVNPGTVSTSGTNMSVTIQAVVSTTGVANVTQIDATANLWTTANLNITMIKYVRNLTAAGNVNGQGAISTLTINGSSPTYYTSGVTGQTNDVLEYVIVSTNTGATSLTGAAVSDAVPTDYVTFQTGSYGGKAVFYIDPTGTPATIDAAAVGANQASYVAPNLVVNVGTGASASSKGTIPATKSVTVAYQVKIK